MKTTLIAIACFFAFCGIASAAPGEVIGQTTVFHLEPSAVLIANDPGEAAGVQAFNYFFCLEVFVALLAVWVRMFIGIFKREVL